jgi:VWFA-related protein
MSLLLTLVLLAQSADPTFRSTVPLVVLPVSVTSADNAFLDGLEAQHFRVLDNGKAREIRLDTSDSLSTPLALVIAIQSNDIANSALLKIQKTGAMIQPLITGERGHTAILSFDERVQLRQEFTNNPTLITQSFQQLKGNPTRLARTNDAVAEAARLLRLRPLSERKVLLVIGESKDRGSKSNFEDTLKLIQTQNISVFFLSFSAYATAFTTRGSDYKPPAGGLNLLAVFGELGRNASTHTAELLTASSGGRRFSFATSKGLEQALSRLGEEIHSQYLLSFTADSTSPGFHTVEISLPGHPTAKVQSRPGYWINPQ